MAVVNVGISDLNIVRVPDVIATYALGSCVGICLYDAETRIGGLAHIMLPWSKENSSAAENTRRFADTGITELIRLMCASGVKQYRLTAKIAGGAQMFKTNSNLFNIGERNVEAVKTVLDSYRIPILAEQTGLDFGRTVFFYPEDGIMEVRSASRPIIKV